MTTAYTDLYAELKEALDIVNFIKTESPIATADPARFNSYCKKQVAPVRAKIHAYIATYHADPIADSIRTTPRYHIDDDDITCETTEFGFIPNGENMTDDELDAWCNDERMTCHSPYDCSGERFTWYIDWKRTPCGVRYIHKTALNY